MNNSKAQQKNNIKEIQEYLYAISFYNDNILRVIPDGIYNRETILAVKGFQKEYDLNTSGEVNRATWEKIVEVYRNYVDSPAESIDIFPYNSFTLKKGQEGSMVSIMQSMLRDISTTYKNIPMPIVNGIFDNNTVSSVKAMQTKARLNPTGIVNKLTWNIIVKTYAHLNDSLKF